MLLCVPLHLCHVSPIHMAGYSKIFEHRQLSAKSSYQMNSLVLCLETETCARSWNCTGTCLLRVVTRDWEILKCLFSFRNGSFYSSIFLKLTDKNKPKEACLYVVLRIKPSLIMEVRALLQFARLFAPALLYQCICSTHILLLHGLLCLYHPRSPSENLVKTISMRTQGNSPGKLISLFGWLVGWFSVLAEPHLNDSNQAFRCFIWFWVWRSFWDAWRKERPAHSQVVDLVPSIASLPHGRKATLGKQCRFSRPDLTQMKGLAV